MTTVIKGHFDPTPLPRVLQAAQDDRWTAEEALYELIDNSFGEARGDASDVFISYDRKARILSVLDNGLGMDHIGSLFQLGSALNYSKRDIGNRGIGGSKAILWLADR